MEHDVINATLYRLDLPLVRPFETASGQVAVRTVGLVSASRDGVTGWGEAAPYPGQDEAFDDVMEAARTATTTPTLAAAIDEAVSDLVARERGERIVSELGPSLETVPMSIAIGMGGGAVGAVEEAARSGISRFKVKIMPGRTSHVAEIRRLFPEVTIGVDANGSFDASTVSEVLDLAGLDLMYVEQPTASADDPAAEVLVEAGFDVFVDESIRSLASAADVLAMPWVSGIVVKPGRLGWRSSVAVVKMARAAGKKWRASGLLETGIGRAYTLALAAAKDAYPSDVAPASMYLTHDVAPHRVIDGHVVVETGPGTGLGVDLDDIANQAVDVIALSGSAIPDRG